MELWSGIVSSNAAKVRIVLAEKEIPYTVRELPWSKKTLWGPKPEEFLAVSPRGEVPVLVDDGFAVHDSTVIVEYLEDRYPNVPLFPTDVFSKAQCRIWEDEGDFNQKHVGVLISDVFLQPPGTPLPNSAQAAISGLDQFYDRLEYQLANQDYLCGNFTAADVSVFVTAFFAQTLGSKITQPNVLAWYNRMLERPAVSGEVKQMLAAISQL